MSSSFALTKEIFDSYDKINWGSSFSDGCHEVLNHYDRLEWFLGLLLSFLKSGWLCLRSEKQLKKRTSVLFISIRHIDIK